MSADTGSPWCGADRTAKRADVERGRRLGALVERRYEGTLVLPVFRRMLAIKRIRPGAGAVGAGVRRGDPDAGGRLRPTARPGAAVHGSRAGGRPSGPARQRHQLSGLFPGAVLNGVGQALVFALSGLYMPTVVSHEAAEYGVGIAPRT